MLKIDAKKQTHQTETFVIKYSQNPPPSKTIQTNQESQRKNDKIYKTWPLDKTENQRLISLIPHSFYPVHSFLFRRFIFCFFLVFVLWFSRRRQEFWWIVWGSCRRGCTAEDRGLWTERWRMYAVLASHLNVTGTYTLHSGTRTSLPRSRPRRLSDPHYPPPA